MVKMLTFLRRNETAKVKDILIPGVLEVGKRGEEVLDSSSLSDPT